MSILYRVLLLYLTDSIVLLEIVYLYFNKLRDLDH